MVAQENQGDLCFFFPKGLDLPPPIVCAGFRTLSVASVQNMVCRGAHLMELALDRA